MRQHRPVSLFVAACLGALGPPAIAIAPSAAWAKPPAKASSPADVLFDEGLALMDGKRFAEACPKLEQSLALDRSGGTLLHLGICYDALGRTASAYATFRDALARAKIDGRTDREAHARRRLDALAPALSKLDVRVPSSAPCRAELVVKVDETPWPSAAWSTPVPVDPGAHVVRAKGGRCRSFERAIDVAPGSGTLEVTIVPELEVAAPSAAPREPGASARPRRAEVGDARASTRRTAAWVVGGVGAAATLAGAFFGLRAFAQNAEAEKHCIDGGTRCTRAGLDATAAANTSATLANVLLPVGGLGLGASAFLLLTSRSGGSGGAPSPSAGPRSLAPATARLVVRGAF